MRVLLDTNGYSALMRGIDAVVERVTRAEEVLLSTVAAGELMFGFRQGTRLRKTSEAAGPGDASFGLLLPWVQAADATTFEVGNVARDNRKPVLQRRSGNQAVDDWKRRTSLFSVAAQLAPAGCHRNINRQQAIREPRCQTAREPRPQPFPAR